MRDLRSFSGKMTLPSDRIRWLGKSGRRAVGWETLVLDCAAGYFDKTSTGYG